MTKNGLRVFALLSLLASTSHPEAATAPDLATRTSAAKATAAGNSLCTGIVPFYWEIGDGTGAKLGVSQGAATYNANSSMLIASASKWLFGAYVAERRYNPTSQKVEFTATDLKALRMQSGYNNLNYSLCLNSGTVDQCFHASSLVNGANDRYSSLQDGAFYYNGGHFQKFGDAGASAGGLGLALETTGTIASGTTALAAEYARLLGSDFKLSFDSPQFAAGIRTTPADYAIFLRKLLNGTLKLGAILGNDAVCTNTVPATNAPLCPSAHYTPAPSGEAWHYSYAHWVEDDPTVGDHAYSSPGAFGFYPWIDKSKTWYGILAREVPVSATDLTPYLQSVKCGRVIRKAWLTGVQQ